MPKKPKAHKLRRNEKIVIPQYFMFVDTETIPQEVNDERTIHNFRLGVSIFLRLRKDEYNEKREVYRFSSVLHFWDYAVSKIKGHNTLNIIAHNALFDMTVLDWIGQLNERGFECKFVFEQGVTFISKWQSGDKRIIILDNSNWFPGKLDTWGKTLGLEKLEMPDYGDTNENWFVYCQRDVEILEELQRWLIRFLIDNNLGSWKLTRASISFNSYRHRFMSHPIYIPVKTRETYLARQAYKGGRTEVFKVGEYKQDVYYKLDINSMYPSVMKNNFYPVAVEGYARKPTMGRLQYILTNHLVIGKFRVRTSLPYFPLRDGQTLTYPIGEFSTFLSTPEIILAIQNDWLIETYEIAWYRKRIIFNEFVDYFYNHRLQAKSDGNKLMDKMFKLILNSLYGKFGQRSYVDKIIGQAPPNTVKTSYLYDAVTGERGVVRQFGTNVIKSVRSGEAYNAFCAIASHVCAYARVLLYDYIMKAGRENVYYCDTDSLIVNSYGNDKLRDFLDNTRLGALKIEGISEYIDIRAPKDYTFGKESKTKGVSKNAEQLDKNTYRQEVWPGLNRLLADSPSQYFNYYVVKTLQRKIKSGTVQPNGEVTPFIHKGD